MADLDATGLGIFQSSPVSWAVTESRSMRLRELGMLPTRRVKKTRRKKATGQCSHFVEGESTNHYRLFKSPIPSLNRSKMMPISPAGDVGKSKQKKGGFFLRLGGC